MQEEVSYLEYNSERSHLIIPEYGRHLQKLIDQATEIEDREERNKAAKYIISVMGSLNPHLIYFMEQHSECRSGFRREKFKK